MESSPTVPRTQGLCLGWGMWMDSHIWDIDTAGYTDWQWQGAAFNSGTHKNSQPCPFLLMGWQWQKVPSVGTGVMLSRFTSSHTFVDSLSTSTAPLPLIYLMGSPYSAADPVWCWLSNTYTLIPQASQTHSFPKITPQTLCPPNTSHPELPTHHLIQLGVC